MSTRGESRGIYADLAKKRAEKYDVELEKRVQTWIEAIIGRPLQPTFREGLMDGQAVCELFNKLVPKSIPKIHKSPIVMFRRENFGFFQNACVKLGLKPGETAVFEDVYEDRNMGQFLINIVALARKTQYQPGYNGPILADAIREAQGGTGPSPAATPKYIPSLAEEAQKVALDAKEASRYVEHGIIANPDAHVYSGKKDAVAGPAPAAPGKYIPTAQELAQKQAQEALDAGKYREHGIMMNPSDNINHGQKS
jgi:hypothetical protein